MSKSQAIAAVTSMLAHVVNVTTGADVKLGRPTVPVDPQPRKVQLFLYQVTPNAAWRNMDLPTRDSAGHAHHAAPARSLLICIISSASTAMKNCSNRN
jgi:hypothetical protein